MSQLPEEIAKIRDELADEWCSKHGLKHESYAFSAYKDSFNACAEIFLKREDEIKYSNFKRGYAYAEKLSNKEMDKLRADLAVATQALEKYSNTCYADLTKEERLELEFLAHRTLDKLNREESK